MLARVVKTRNYECNFIYYHDQLQILNSHQPHHINHTRERVRGLISWIQMYNIPFMDAFTFFMPFTFFPVLPLSRPPRFEIQPCLFNTPIEKVSLMACSGRWEEAPNFASGWLPLGTRSTSKAQIWHCYSLLNSMSRAKGPKSAQTSGPLFLNIKQYGGFPANTIFSTQIFF